MGTLLLQVFPPLTVEMILLLAVLLLIVLIPILAFLLYIVQKRDRETPVPAFSGGEQLASGSVPVAAEPLQLHSSAPLPVEGPHCPRCGAWVRPDDVFCMMCGYRLREESPQEAETERVIPVPPPEPEPLPARLLVKLEGQVLQEHVLLHRLTSIGRSSKNMIALTGDKVASRHHAMLAREGERYLLTDEGSLNGTFINGKKLIPHRSYTLQDGMLIRIGSHELQFEQPKRIEDLPTVIQQVPEEIFAGTRKTTPREVSASPAELFFTAVYPRELSAATWETLLIYSYLEAFREYVFQEIERFQIERRRFPLATAGLPALLQTSNITLVPEGEGIHFSPKRLTFKGIEGVHCSSFSFAVKQQWVGSRVPCTLSIYIGPLLVARLKMTSFCLEATQQRTSHVPLERVTTRIARKVYPAYSFNDTMIARACLETAQALHFAFPLEVEAVRRRRAITPELEHKIAEADLFQLFWSSYAAQSDFLTKEWELALRKQSELRQDFLCPVYWDVPPPSPVPRLASLSFSYLPVYTFLHPETGIE
uniref:FHA domain-containing protein n=1 Tax=Thermosporothrix sp. COM3 TaxID=2490863 RepID=A0A455SNQ0_9CHLR|nr:hypothetical protein KTC_40970 [Thermosporothrix sp. COM3]